MEKITYSLKKVNPKDLKTNEQFEELFGFTNSNRIYVDDSNYFKFYDRPLLFNGKVISLAHEVQAAKNNHVHEIDVVEISGIDENELIHLISHRTFYEAKSNPIRYRLICKLIPYLKANPKGMEWSKKIGGKMRYKLAKILNISETYVGYLLNVYRNAPNHIIEKFEHGDISLKKANEFANLKDTPLDIPNSEGTTKQLTAYEALELTDESFPDSRVNFKAPQKVIESVKNDLKLTGITLTFENGDIVNFDLQNNQSSKNGEPISHRFEMEDLKHQRSYKLGRWIKLNINKDISFTTVADNKELGKKMKEQIAFLKNR